MKVLLTGAFGNVGFWTLQELLRQGHTVRCFGLKKAHALKKAQQIEGKAEVAWGDVRNRQDIEAAIEGQEIVLHMAFIIPPDVAQNPDLAEAVNVGGTRNLLEAAKKQQTPPKIFFASSFDVFGHTQEQDPPRKVTDPVQATDDYSRHKIECEELVRASGLQWAIFRFSDMPPLIVRKPQPIMFSIPLDQRFEMLHPTDAALAIANGIRNDIWGKIWLVGGGQSCQIRYADLVQTMVESMGIGKLPPEAFSKEPYCTDWLDTQESQALLNYQRHSFQDIIQELTTIADPGPTARLVLPLLRPFIRRSILKMSPYFHR